MQKYIRDSLGRFVGKFLKSRAEKIYQSRKRKLLIRLLRHPISVELREKTSPSRYLKNVKGGSTLYGFMGFDIATQSDPVKDLYDYLEQNIAPIYIYKKNGFAIEVTLKVPTYQEMRAEANLTLEWQGGISWPEALEIGISGIGYFMRPTSKFSGRSTLGFQAKKPIRNESVISVNYLSEIYKNDTNFGS